MVCSEPEQQHHDTSQPRCDKKYPIEDPCSFSISVIEKGDQEDFEAALLHFNQVVEIKPKVNIGWRLRGLTHLSLGKVSEALGTKGVLDISPESVSSITSMEEFKVTENKLFDSIIHSNKLSDEKKAVFRRAYEGAIYGTMKKSTFVNILQDGFDSNTSDYLIKVINDLSNKKTALINTERASRIPANTKGKTYGQGGYQGGYRYPTRGGFPF